MADCCICSDALLAWGADGVISAAVPTGTLCASQKAAKPQCIVGKLGGEGACGHAAFCFDCVDHWAAIANFCPLCKAKFTLIERWELVRAVLPLSAAVNF